jgi:hypothetical protein
VENNYKIGNISFLAQGIKNNKNHETLLAR